MFIIFIFAFIAGTSYASHFRYGTISWQPVSNTTTTVTMLITHSWGWRNDFSAATACDSTTIANRTLMGVVNSILCDVGCTVANQVVGDTSMYCTAYSGPLLDNWSMGQKSYPIIIPVSSDVEIYFTSSSWVTLVVGGGTWMVRAKINTLVRSDIGQINSSPITTSAPSYCIRQGYIYQIILPMADANQGDDLRCRWSLATPTDECGGICGSINTISNLTYSKSSAGYQCLLTFNAALISTTDSGLNYILNNFYIHALIIIKFKLNIAYVAAALMIEDFATSTSTTPLSGVPLQFLIKITYSASTCTIP